MEYRSATRMATSSSLERTSSSERRSRVWMLWSTWTSRPEAMSMFKSHATSLPTGRTSTQSAGHTGPEHRPRQEGLPGMKRLSFSDKGLAFVAIADDTVLQDDSDNARQRMEEGPLARNGTTTATPATATAKTTTTAEARATATATTPARPRPPTSCTPPPSPPTVAVAFSVPSTVAVVVASRRVAVTPSHRRVPSRRPRRRCRWRCRCR